MTRGKAEHNNAWVAAVAKDAPPSTRQKNALIFNKRLVFYRALFLCLGVLGVSENLIFPGLSQGGYDTSSKLERREGKRSGRDRDSATTVEIDYYLGGRGRLCGVCYEASKLLLLYSRQKYLDLVWDFLQ